ncbi:hypothetical protein OS493_014662 [Desmophyllum pertusum]|uniref:Uncharacterized protein n=1 Tax=Desmophyllum pertusum TaxID=174260 RepID=A0A9W9YCZ1_9CNID|nr:hypothetical protein OS493_014662 [Desmophyllum pertusum]
MRGWNAYPRADQCEVKRLIRFIDGNKYRWTYNPAVPVTAGQECKLLCIAEVGIRQFAKYSFGFVDDGTRCDDYDENSGFVSAANVSYDDRRRQRLAQYGLPHQPRSFGFVDAGTRFKYTRDELKKEKITAQGPLNQDVELLYLVQSWKEEYQVRIRYLIPRSKDVNSDTRIVRSLEHGEVSFKWTSRSLGCSESCGGG